MIAGRNGASPKEPVARGRRLSARLRPLTEARVAYFEKERRELVGLNFAETIRSPLGLIGSAKAGHRATDDGAQGVPCVRERSPEVGHHIDDDALGYVGYFAELLDEWAQDADADERLYRLGTSMLHALAAGAPAEPLARYFEYWLLRLQGVYPEARGDALGRGDGVSGRLAQSGAGSCGRAAGPSVARSRNWSRCTVASSPCTWRRH